MISNLNFADWCLLSDDLNPLFVYEAKMSFLIRLAENRRGAERLIDCRILHVLAQVDFLDTRPEADESFIGMF